MVWGGNRPVTAEVNDLKLELGSTLTRTRRKALGDAIELERGSNGKYCDVISWMTQGSVLTAAVKGLKIGGVLRREAGFGSELEQDWFLQTPRILQSGDYIFTPVRWVSYANPKRFFGEVEEERREKILVHNGDQIVQEAMSIALEQIYVDKFAKEVSLCPQF